MMSQQQGHLNLSFVVAVPLCLWACIAATKANWGKWRLGIILGVLLAFQFGVSQEIYASLCMFAVISIVILYILDARQRPVLVALSGGMICGLGISLVVCAPLIFYMLHWYGDDTSGILSPIYMTSDVLGFVIPTRVDWFGGQFFGHLSVKFPGNISEQSAYLGLPLIVLLISIYVQNKRNPVVKYLSLMILLACVLSLGPYVHIANHTISTAPWILAVNLPLLHYMYADRFMMYAWLAIAILLSTWFAGPGGRKTWRYAAFAVCIIFLMPDRAVDRNWTNLHIPSVFTDGSIPISRRILVLPELGDEMAFQYASGMRFSMVGQGYLITGDPQPFARWPIFNSLRNSQFGNIDPKIFASYLASYGVQEVVVMKTGYVDFWHDQKLDDSAASASAIRLLSLSGWQIAGADEDATWLRPKVPQIQPGPADVAAFMAMPSVETLLMHREKSIRDERRWVCQIRAVASFAGLPSKPWLELYINHAHPPLAVDAIACGRQ